MARERTGESPRLLPHDSAPGLSIAELRQIITLMRSGEIQEISIEREDGALRLHLRKPAPDSTVLAELDLDGLGAAERHAPSDGAGLPDPDDELVPVTAPFVGRFRAGGKSGARALPKPGDAVKQGQVLGAIETLNVLSEVEAGQAGRIAEVKVKDGQAVEYGQVLLLIEPGQP
jgi:biotin carboxyl carrier protein